MLHFFLRLMPLAAYFIFSIECNAAPKCPSTVRSSLSPSLFDELLPYFLADNDPLKCRLDLFFSKTRATQSEQAFAKAGFQMSKIREPTNIITGKHPKFEELIFKVYLDTQPDFEEWRLWKRRIDGAHAIQNCIEQHGFQHFVVPKKWIYPLPLKPSPPDKPDFNRKHSILIAERLDLLPTKENLKAYKKLITPEILQELYTILTELGLIDSVYIDNIPFTREGKIAFIDTEHWYPGQAVSCYHLTRRLSPEMQDVWKGLMGDN